MNKDWKLILKQTQLHLDLLEPFIAFRHSLLQILKCKECTAEHLLESASILRKVFLKTYLNCLIHTFSSLISLTGFQGSRFSLAAAAMHEFKLLFLEDEKDRSSFVFSLGKVHYRIIESRA